MASGVANASLYRVDFSGTAENDGGTYDGYFTYDTAGLDLNGKNEIDHVAFGENDVPGAGFGTELLFNYDFTNGSGSFDETVAGVGELTFSSGNLVSYVIGGYVNGIFRVNFADFDDFFVCSECQYSSFFTPDLADIKIYPSTQSVHEISAVPLPAGVWVFGAGLLGLAGLKKRKAAKAARAEGLMAA